MELSCRRSASWRTRSSSPGSCAIAARGSSQPGKQADVVNLPAFLASGRAPGLAAGRGPDGPGSKTHTTRDIVVFPVPRGAVYGRLMPRFARFHGSCATRCHVVPPSASYGRLMPRGAGFCHVFGGAFTVRLAALSTSSQSRPESRPPSRDSHARAAAHEASEASTRSVDAPRRPCAVVTTANVDWTWRPPP